MKKRKTGLVSSFLVLLILGFSYFAPENLLPQKGKIETIGETYKRALSFYQHRRIEESLRLISGGLKIDPSSAALHNLAGWCHYRLNDLDKAEEEFSLSNDLDSTNAEALTGLGYVKISRGEHREAFSRFKQALRFSPLDRDALVGYGICLFEFRYFDRAKEVFQYVVDAHPDDEEARSWLERCSPEVAGTVSPEGMKPYSAAGGPNLVFRAQGDFFTVWDGEQFRPIFLKGVNLSATLPGGFPGDFSATERDYRFFIAEIAELGANVVRVYSLQPPRLYKALLEHNRANREKPLYLLQGVWAEVPPRFDYFDAQYLESFRKKIRETIDAVYGNIVLKGGPGRPEGRYTYDVHDHLCGFILGREWEPFTVVANDSINEGIDSYQGKMVSVLHGTPTECWVAQIMDFALSYEDSVYNWQHPVSFSNWPTLDPLAHPTEIPLKSEFGRQVYNDDVVTVDISKIRPTAANRAGIFATYHVYPYHPDFMAVDPVYQHYRDELGRLDSYRAYLNELKHYHRGLPLLIGEYGVPASRGNAHPHPQRLCHGGHSEKDQGEIYAQLTRDIWQSGCAGGVAFELLDEWFKKTWITLGREIPEENDPVWLNLQDPEENFGLLKVEPQPSIVIDGRGQDWRTEPLMEDRIGEADDEQGDLEAFYVASDEAYIYLRLDLKTESIDWDEAELLILISTYSDKKGDHRIRLKSTSLDLPFGAEFAIYLKSPWEGFLLEDNSYSSKHNDNRSDPNSDGQFTHIERRVFREYPHLIQPPIYHDQGRLYYGDASSIPENEPLIDWFSRGDMVEIRLPWALLKVSDPSSHQVLDYVGNRPEDFQSRGTEGFKFLCLSLKPGKLWERSRLVDALPDPERLKETTAYRWEGWEKLVYRIRRKASFEYLREAFATLPHHPKGAEQPPQRFEWEYGAFDFKRLLDDSYHSKEQVVARLERVLQETEDPFARAELNLILDRYRGVTPSSSTAEPYRISAGQTDSRQRLLSLLGAYSIEKLFDASKDLKRLLWRNRSLAPKLSTWMQRKKSTSKVDIPGTECRTKGDKIIIGASRIVIPHGASVKTQVERVVRDWLSLYNLDLPPWELDTSRIVPWHEGLSLRKLVDYAEVKIKPVWFCPALRVGEVWYAPDMEGGFRFPISPDKIYNYPTNKIVDDDLVVINDTHGVSAVAWDAEGAFLVVGCGDYPGKVEAAYYLAGKGINVLCPGDRFVPLLLGTNTSGKVLGSAPIRKSDHGAVIGDQPVEIDLSERIVVSTTDRPYPVQYYDTPGRYFWELQRYLDRKLNLIEFAVDREGGTVDLIEFAHNNKVGVVAVRVRTDKEYEAVRDWLSESKDNRAILFHSSLYPEGYRLFTEFPGQTSFDDPYPVVK